MTPADDLAEALRVALDELSLALLRRRPAADAPPTIADGAAGLALAHAALDRALPGRGHLHAAARHLEHALDAMSTSPLPASLVIGYVGVMWVADRLAPDDIAPALARVDAPLVASLRRRADVDGHDLFFGAAGTLRYALDRSSPARERLVAASLARLERAAVADGDGAAWRSTVLLPQRQRVPRLGIAHGGAGVLSSLAVCAMRGVEADRARRLAERTAAWMLARKRRDGDWRFPDAERADGTAIPSRNAYCIGDAGTAVGLLRAGVAFDRADWREAAIDAGLAAARRSFEVSGVVDCGVCHGAAGLALMFHRLGEASGEGEFFEARDRWLRELLSMRRAGKGIGGVRAWEHAEPGGRWVSSPGLLSGAAGVALVIATTLGVDDEGWDAPLGTERIISSHDEARGA